MTREKLLSVMDIAAQLNTGKATTKFLLKRFSRWMPEEHIDGQAFYSPAIVKLLFVAQGNLEMGVMPEDIEKKLAAMCGPGSKDPINCLVPPCQTEDSHLDQHRLTLLESLFEEIGQQQKKIAVAQERRALAEEKKVAALTALVRELQALNKRQGADPELEPVAKAAAIIAEENPDDIPLDDLSQLIDQAETPQDKLDDLSLLIDEAETPQGLLDDLSQLIDPAERSQDKLDDLSQPIDGTDHPQETLDDLSLLLDDKKTPSVGLDDLSLLVDKTAPAENMQKPEQKLDDLSALIEDEVPMDDLSNLIDPPVKENQLKMDDLSALIAEPAIHIDVSPEQDLEKYKAAIVKVIIELKENGLGIEETTDRLNTDKVKTLSGKKEWSSRAISQIYRFIESAT